jgi:acyl-CoA thioester hydrolase
MNKKQEVSSRVVRENAASVEFDVPFHDVDQMGVVWHGHYLKYFEYARTKLFQDLDLGGEISGKFPYVWVVIESKIRHTAPLRFENRARVTARLVDVDYRVHVAYEVTNLTTGERAAKGHTMLATIDRAGEMLVQTPDDLLSHLTQDEA